MLVARVKMLIELPYLTSSSLLRLSKLNLGRHARSRLEKAISSHRRIAVSVEVIYIVNISVISLPAYIVVAKLERL